VDSCGPVVIRGSITLRTSFGDLSFRHLACAGQQGLIVAGLMQPRTPTPVRLQSSCVFSESFAAEDCDCALQLASSLKIISDEGGLVVYLYEEGRGAGLMTKIEAIRLQKERGIDTAAAYDALGLQRDLRDYSVAADAIREVLGPGCPIELLTNNPAKVESLVKHGINVVRRRPLVIPRTEAVSEYLKEKVKVLGHVIHFDE